MNQGQTGSSGENPPRTCIVVSDYNMQYPAPIAVAAGEIFHISDRVDPWNNNPAWLWVWCTDQRGKSGWVPRNIIVIKADGVSGTVREPYDATELTAAAGETLVTQREESGWLWCTNESGKSGWIPLENIKFS